MLRPGFELELESRDLKRERSLVQSNASSASRAEFMRADVVLLGLGEMRPLAIPEVQWVLIQENALISGR